MTREEVIKILEILHKRMDYPTKEALAIAIDHLSEPSLSSDLDEAAEKYLDGLFGKGKHQDFYVQLFKAGVRWLAGQGVEARCVESSNPLSDSPNKRLHLITLLYEENEDTPYVIGGDKVIVQIRKI